MSRRRQPDIITLETPRGTFNRFQSLSVTNEIANQSEATFELGDDGSDDGLYRALEPGSVFRVCLNGRPLLAGRVEVRRSPGSAEGGVKIQVLLRTKMSDARYCSADPGVRIEKTSLADYVIGQYAKLGYTKADFVFNLGAVRDLMTGLAKGETGHILDLVPIKTDQAKAQPTETVFSACERHLKRFHATQWDAPDGRICLGRPDDEQSPSYNFRARRQNPQRNNLLNFERGLDWSQVPSEMWVYGQTVGKDVASAAIKGVSKDEDLLNVFDRVGHFYRPVVLQNQEAKALDDANAMALRERKARSREKDTWTVKVDGWTHWTSNGDQIPYAINTVAEMDVDHHPPGRYLIVGTRFDYSLAASSTTQIQLVAKGIWVI